MAEFTLDELEGRVRSVVRDEVGGLRGEVGGLRSEVGGLRGEVGGLRDEVGGLRGEVKQLGNKIEQVHERVTKIKEMLEDDFRAEALRLDWVDRRSARTQRLLNQHLAKHSATS